MKKRGEDVVACGVGVDRQGQSDWAEPTLTGPLLLHQVSKSK